MPSFILDLGRYIEHILLDKGDIQKDVVFISQTHMSVLFRSTLVRRFL